MNEILTCLFISEEGKLSTSQDASCKYVVEETTDVGEENPAAPQSASGSLDQRYLFVFSFWVLVHSGLSLVMEFPATGVALCQSWEWFADSSPSP